MRQFARRLGADGSVIAPVSALDYADTNPAGEVMSFLKKLTGLFTRGGRDDSLLLQGIELAKAKRPADAIEVYNRLLKSSSTGDETRARALFNRALAHSALDNDEQAITDLEAVLKLPDLPDNVQTAARTQLARVKRRNKEP